jgi:hypothetical protein
MNSFEAYCTYLALQQHFKVDSYDYFKYNKKVRAKISTFETRNDRYFFTKLAKHSDPESFVLANLVDGKSDYIADIVTDQGKEIYLSWLKRRESISYLFKSQLNVIEGSFVDSLRIQDGQHPKLLKLYSRGAICIETLIILDRMTGCFERWNTQIEEQFIWPSIHRKCSKYAAFCSYDMKKMKAILLDNIEDRR